MGHLKTLVLAALLPLAHCGPVAIRDTPANVPALTAFKYSGSGCTQGSNSVKTVGGWNEATFSFSDFIANSPGEDATENCEVHFQGSGASAGWQVAVSELNVNGKVVLPPGTRFDYYWQIYWSDDASNTRTVRDHMLHTASDTVTVPLVVHRAVDNPVWSKCIGADGNPGILNVNLRLAVNGDGGGAFIVDSENVKYQWRRC